MRSARGRDENLQTAGAAVRAAAAHGAKIVVLPELFTSAYFCQRPDDRAALETAEEIPGPTTAAIANMARESRVVLIGGSVFERATDGTRFNTCVVFGPDGSPLGTYRKTHIPEDILYHEQHYFSPGDTGVVVVDTPHGRIAPLICYDQWYPEAARLAALAGAEIIVYPTAIGTIDDAVEANITGDWEQMWRAAQVGHAACNNVFVAAVNRVGREGAISFWGGSFVADPAGAVVAAAGADETILYAACDLSRVKPLQEAWRFFANRRPEQYERLLRKEKPK
ncbi:MAG: acyltransferase [Deltaproteobacteria bacterium]|nr:acyltransferase [Deltaproteobacteria bacterium]